MTLSRSPSEAQSDSLSSFYLALIVKVKTLPSPIADSHEILPSRLSQIYLQIERPIPLEYGLSFLLSVLLVLRDPSNTLSTSSCDIPTPSSVT